MVPGKRGRIARGRANRLGRGKSVKAIRFLHARFVSPTRKRGAEVHPSLARRANKTFLAFFVFAFLALIPSPAFAGLYYSGEHYAELPSRFRGFLVDFRALRAAAIERPRDMPVSPLRGDFLIALERLEKLAKT